MLLGAAKILVQHKDKIKGSVLLAFEQGEEWVAGFTTFVNDYMK